MDTQFYNPFFRNPKHCSRISDDRNTPTATRYHQSGNCRTHAVPSFGEPKTLSPSNAHTGESATASRRHDTRMNPAQYTTSPIWLTVTGALAVIIAVRLSEREKPKRLSEMVNIGIRPGFLSALLALLLLFCFGFLASLRDHAIDKCSMTPNGKSSATGTCRR